jgi:hypothetical protein
MMAFGEGSGYSIGNSSTVRHVWAMSGQGGSICPKSSLRGQIANADRTADAVFNTQDSKARSAFLVKLVHLADRICQTSGQGTTSLKSPLRNRFSGPAIGSNPIYKKEKRAIRLVRFKERDDRGFDRPCLDWLFAVARISKARPPCFALN